jgi:hypothetical protein
VFAMEIEEAYTLIGLSEALHSIQSGACLE